MKPFQDLVNYVIGGLTTTSIYTKANNFRVIMECEVPKRHVSRPTLSTNIWGGRGKKSLLVEIRQRKVVKIINL